LCIRLNFTIFIEHVDIPPAICLSVMTILVPIAAWGAGHVLFGRTIGATIGGLTVLGSFFLMAAIVLRAGSLGIEAAQLKIFVLVAGSSLMFLWTFILRVKWNGVPPDEKPR
jgi:hypothetical protein